MEFEKKYLPLEEAVRAAVNQNIKTDLRRGAICSDNLKGINGKNERILYEMSARHQLLYTGENFPPQPELVAWWERKPKHICLEGWKEPPTETTS